MLSKSRARRLGPSLYCGRYNDGTVWFGFEDDESRYAEVCIDGRTGSPTRYRLFDLRRHPKKPDAMLLELGAPEEGIVIPLISRWLNSAAPVSWAFTKSVGS